MGSYEIAFGAGVPLEGTIARLGARERTALNASREGAGGRQASLDPPSRDEISREIMRSLGSNPKAWRRAWRGPAPTAPVRPASSRQEMTREIFRMLGVEPPPGTA